MNSRKRLLGGVISSFLLLVSGFAYGGCLQDAGTLVTSLNCNGMPTIPKFFDPQTFSWSGKQILALNDGNEIRYYNITNPLNPTPLSTSNFNIPNQGDSDYDLISYSICDNCRYAVGVWKLGIVIWDQGTGTNPTFGERHFYPVSQGPRGAFVYTHDGHQYLASKYLPGDKTGTTFTVYRITGTTQLLSVGNFATPGFKMTGGVKVGGVIYIGMTDNWLYTFRLPTELGMPITYLGRSPIKAYLGRGRGFGVSGNTGVSAYIDGAKVWNLTNPELPVSRATISGNYQYAAIGGQFIWMVGQNNIPKTFKIDNPSSPVPVDPDFWSLSNPWNDYGTTCEFPTGGVFSPDGRMLYMSRYAVAQKVNFTGCMGSPTPTPTPTITPIPTCVPGCIPGN